MSEIELNGSLTTTELKKLHPFRLVGGVETWNGLVPHPCVVDKSSGGISQQQGVIAPHQASQPRVPVARREFPTISGCTNQWGLWLSGLLEFQEDLKGLGPDLLELQRSEFQH